MYAPVKSAVLREVSGSLIGYAAPAGGPSPCRLRLTSDGIPIAEARATRFSETERKARRRLGWCGVEIPGLAVAQAMGDRLEVRCAVSEKLLWHSSAKPPAMRRDKAATPLSVADILGLSRAVDTCTIIAPILPFARNHFDVHGLNAGIDATFRMLLGRPAESSAIEYWLSTYQTDIVATVLAAVIGSGEYREIAFPFIPGPFHSAFKYDLSPLG